MKYVIGRPFSSRHNDNVLPRSDAPMEIHVGVVTPPFSQRYDNRMSIREGQEQEENQLFETIGDFFKDFTRNLLGESDEDSLSDMTSPLPLVTSLQFSASSSSPLRTTLPKPSSESKNTLLAEEPGGRRPDAAAEGSTSAAGTNHRTSTRVTHFTESTEPATKGTELPTNPGQAGDSVPKRGTLAPTAGHKSAKSPSATPATPHAKINAQHVGRQPLMRESNSASHGRAPDLHINTPTNRSINGKVSVKFHELVGVTFDLTSSTDTHTAQTSFLQ